MAINKAAFEPPGLINRIHKTGCGDPSWIKLRAAGAVVGTAEPIADAHGPADGRFRIINCSILTFFINWTKGNLSSIQFYPEFSDESLATWYPATIWEITAGSGILICRQLLFHLDTANAKRIIQIPNPGAAWGRIIYDGTTITDNVNSDLELWLSRSWGNQQLIQV